MLRVNNLVGFGLGGTVVPATISYQTSKVSGSTTTSYSFASTAFGAAQADRLIVVTVSGLIAPSSGTGHITGVTVGGITATEVIQDVTFGGGNSVHCGIYVASVPTGTTGTVVVTTKASGSISRAGIGVFAVYGANATATDSDSDTGTSTKTCVVNVPAGGVVIGVTCNYTSSRTTTWGNLTERYDQNINSGTYQSGADAAFETAQTSLSITAAPSAATQCSMCVAVFGP